MTLIAAFATATLALAAGPARAEDNAPAPTAKAEAPARTITLSTSSGQMMRLARPMNGLFVADESVADVQVKSPSQFYIFGKKAGQTSVFATDKAGHVVWSADVRVANGAGQVDAFIKLAMPENDITATPIGGMVLLSGTVLGPKDAEEAERLVQKFVGDTVQVINRLKIATPQQVMLSVKIAEVSRSVARDIGVNFLNQPNGNPILFGSQGSVGNFSTDSKTGQTIANFSQLAGTTLGLAGHAFGADIMASLQLHEQDGQVTMLAEPNLVALSGETATFLAGGEIPIPQSQGLGSVSVEFKQYGVSLAFTPVVMTGNRISLRVRPEVSQISDIGSVKLNGFVIPGLTTRRAETTVELGSGQSFVIGGLLQNNHNNSISRAPFLGDLPIIGALFRSNSFQKSESELVIVVTPYLVKAVDANRIVLPTDGYRAATNAERVLEGKLYKGEPGSRPKPTMAPPTIPAGTKN